MASANVLVADENWAFRPIVSPSVPEASSAPWAANAIDRFVQARHVAADVRPAARTSKASWIRRVAVGLTGLPPSLDDVRSFVSGAEGPNDAERWLDRYLASPQYGERWGRHWLDVVRYADTDGFAIDGVRPTLWRYRDYVLRSFNADKSFDQFVKEQLAGDELEGCAEGEVATGFYRLGPWEADNMIPEVRRQNYGSSTDVLVESLNCRGDVPAESTLDFGCEYPQHQRFI